MKTIRALAILTAATLFFGTHVWASGGIASGVEPDDFDSGAALTFVNPLVDLFTFQGTSSHDAGADGFPVEFGSRLAPSVIPVTSLTNAYHLGGYTTSTGTRSFGHAGVGFTPETRAIGMRLNVPANAVSIDVIGNSTIDTIGILEAYDSTGNLIGVATSARLGQKRVATLEFITPGFDIVFARAYSSPDGSPFGVFDNLRFSVVPEPTTLLLTALASVGLLLRRRR